jgi:alkylated DNA repair dioxygenase AlkB
MARKHTPILTTLLNRDGIIDFCEDFIDPTEAEQWLRVLSNTLDWREEFLSIAGRTIPVPRLVAWHGDPGASYSYSGLRHDPVPWTPALLELRQRVETACGHGFNSVLGNLYRHGQDAVSWHADDEPELGFEPVIASLSLGAERRFEVRHNRMRDILKLPLNSGSLLLMRGAFQHHWQHRIPRQAGITAPRINLTFRFILPIT